MTRRTLLSGPLLLGAADYAPPPDSAGGWRRNLDARRFESVFDYLQSTTKHGGLAVVQRGWFVYERYFGLGHAQAAPNSASVGKSFTSIAMGILLGRRRDHFRQGLHTEVYRPKHLPEQAFPAEPGRESIKLGHLLAMTAGIPGNNPGMIRGKPVNLDPPGPDGWEAMDDAIAAGKKDGVRSARRLWCKPGEGYSYATSSIHLVSMIIRKATGIELAEFVRRELAIPMGWGKWGWGYRNQPLTHTPGGGGICLCAADMLRFGYLLLHKGKWAGRTIVPADYVHACGRPSEFNPHFPYSLQFNVNGDGRVAGAPSDAFWKSGSGGHCLYVIPSLDLVAWKLGGRDEQYAKSNTGLDPAPATSVRGDSGGLVPHEQAVERTLQMLVEHASKA
jgi:CubicO group peptidase (beta-lactamase class C family)